MSRRVDLSLPDYNQWLKLVFDHPAPEDEAEAVTQVWYRAEEVDLEWSDAAVGVAHFTQLCRDFKNIADDYTLAQLNQGLWLLLSGGLGSFGDLLANMGVPLEARIACVRSMLRPYADFVAPSQVEEMENCFDMWWHQVCNSFWSTHLNRLKGEEIWAEMERVANENEANRSPEKEAWDERFHQIVEGLNPDEDLNEVLRSYGMSLDDFPDEPLGGEHIDITYAELEASEQQLMDVMLETLQGILRLEDDRCQYYALHGLGHLNHPARSDVVQRFIDVHRHELNESELRWVESCRDGTVM